MKEIKYIEWETNQIMIHNYSCSNLPMQIVVKGGFTYKIIDKEIDNNDKQILDTFMSEFYYLIHYQDVDSNGIYKIDVNNLKKYINDHQDTFEIQELQIKNIELDEDSQLRMDQYNQLYQSEVQETNCGFNTVIENNANNLENSIKDTKNSFNFFPIILTIIVILSIAVIGLLFIKKRKK